jgi:predicted transcriptional regulator
MLINNPLSKQIMGVSQLNCNEKIVYLALISFSDRRNTCFPAHKTIAQFCSRSVSTVKRALLRLRELGYITWQHCFDSQNARLRNKYMVHKPDAAADGDKPVSSIIVKRYEMPDYKQTVLNGFSGFRRVAAALFLERRPYKERRIQT